jgi:hypothetical protein
LFSLTTALLAPAVVTTFASFSPALAYTASDIAANAETHADGTYGGECKVFASNAVQAVTGTYPGGYQQGFAAGAIEVTNAANAVRGDIIQITPAGSVDSTAESLHGADSAHRLHTAIILAPRNADGTFNVIDSNFNNDYKVLHHSFNPYIWANGSIVKIWHYTGTGGTPPGGWWLGPTPSDGTTLAPSPAPSSVPVNVHGEAGSATLDHIDITWEAEGTNSWSKQTQWLNTNASIARSDFSYSIPKPSNGWPTSLIISFDVYGTDGRVHYAPQGMRRICIANVSCASTVDAPVKSGSSGQIGGGNGQSSSCSPSTNQVALFTSTNYTGQCVVRDIGSYPDPASIGLPNDSIQSVKVGGGINVQMCRDNNFSNTCEWTTQNIPDLSTHSVGSNQISSVTVQGGYAQSGGCSPGADQVSFFVDPNYGGQCVTKNFGTYNDPSAIALPNDSISSLKVGSNAKTEVCRDNGLSNTCEWIEQDVSDLGTHSVGSDQISSAYVFLRGGISLCDGTNYSGNCRVFSDGTTNLADYGWANRARSVIFSGAYANRYHIVLWTGPNLTGGLYHADNSVADLGNPYNGNIQSINIYPHPLPAAPSNPTPAAGTVLPNATTNVTLSWSGSTQNQVHVWGPNGYDFQQSWTSSSTLALANLVPGTYYWQAQSQNEMGAGPWSDVWSFTINTPPAVTGGNVSMDSGTTRSIQIQAPDAEQQAVSLSASGLPSFATFVDNGGGNGTLSLAPAANVNGNYAITITASDGDVSSTGTINLTVNQAQPVGYAAQYFNNQTLSGTPVLTRTDNNIGFDWGGGSPDPAVPADHFSARWTKTTDLAAGTYFFSVTADDGVRLYVDGNPVIDQWVDQGATTYTDIRQLSAGTHTIVMEYYENTGGAVAQMNYFLADDGSGNYQASYWDNQDLSGDPVLTRDEATIDNDWGGGSPDSSVPVDHFSARWTKMANFDAGTYQFTATGDDGLRLYIDDRLVIDQWVDQGATTYTANKTLSAGQHLIRYEYYENTGGAVAQLSYQQTSSGSELLSSAWHLAGTEAQEAYQSMDQNALQGKTTLRITYNLHGLSALGNDASAIIIDQNGWHYISLSNYGQNGKDGEQTVDIPLSDFSGLDLSSPVDGTIHTRFWNSDPYSVDITSIQLL